MTDEQKTQQGAPTAGSECSAGLDRWRPIETAPKDGTRIIVAVAGGPVWCNVYWQKMARKDDRWQSFVGAVPFEPTHWQPIPEPPAA